MPENTLDILLKGLTSCQKLVLTKILKKGWIESSVIHHIYPENLEKIMPKGKCDFKKDISDLVKLRFLKSKNYPVLTREAYPLVRDYVKNQLRKKLNG